MIHVRCRSTQLDGERRLEADGDAVSCSPAQVLDLGAFGNLKNHPAVQ